MPNVFVLGDSHGHAIRSGFERRGWTVFGGVIQAGIKFEYPFFEPRDNGPRFLNEAAQTIFSKSLDAAGAPNLAALDMPIVSTIGFNTHRFTGGFAPYTLDEENRDAQFVSEAAFRASALGSRRYVLEFYKAISTHNVYVVYSPQRIDPARIEIARRFEELLALEVRALGLTMLDIRDATVGPERTLLPQYWSETPKDEIHANASYGEVVADALPRLLDEQAKALQRKSPTTSTAKRSIFHFLRKSA